MKVALVDYIGYGDTNGKPVGHALKILKEYGDLISDRYDIEYYVSRGYANVLQKEIIWI